MYLIGNFEHVHDLGRESFLSKSILQCKNAENIFCSLTDVCLGVPLRASPRSFQKTGIKFLTKDSAGFSYKVLSRKDRRLSYSLDRNV